MSNSPNASGNTNPTGYWFSDKSAGLLVYYQVKKRIEHISKTTMDKEDEDEYINETLRLFLEAAFKLSIVSVTEYNNVLEHISKMDNLEEQNIYLKIYINAPDLYAKETVVPKGSTDEQIAERRKMDISKVDELK
jgi:hypothetical protein